MNQQIGEPRIASFEQLRAEIFRAQSWKPDDPIRLSLHPGHIMVQQVLALLQLGRLTHEEAQWTIITGLLDLSANQQQQIVDLVNKLPSLALRRRKGTMVSS
jgi:hypothetical protein